MMRESTSKHNYFSSCLRGARTERLRYASECMLPLKHLLKVKLCHKLYCHKDFSSERWNNKLLMLYGPNDWYCKEFSTLPLSQGSICSKHSFVGLLSVNVKPRASETFLLASSHHEMQSYCYVHLWLLTWRYQPQNDHRISAAWGALSGSHSSSFLSMFTNLAQSVFSDVSWKFVLENCVCIFQVTAVSAGMIDACLSSHPVSRRFS